MSNIQGGLKCYNGLFINNYTEKHEIEDFDLSIIIGGSKTKSKFDLYNYWPFQALHWLASKLCFRQNA